MECEQNQNDEKSLDSTNVNGVNHETTSESGGQESQFMMGQGNKHITDPCSRHLISRFVNAHQQSIGVVLPAHRNEGEH